MLLRTLCCGLLILAPALVFAQANHKISQPGQYKGYSPPQYEDFELSSFYLTMADSVDLAVDLYLPKGLPDTARIPTIFYQTRYIRSVELIWPLRCFNRTRLTNIRRSSVESFIRHGYAVVVVDARGTGASFGHRRMEFSPQEVQDAREVVEWITEQPWSNDQVGATGVSYVGTTALHLPTVKHPAVQAIFPRSAILDLYADLAAPGGISQEPFVDIWGITTQALDHNNFRPFGFLANLAVKGPRPVDGEHGRRRLRQALAQHEENIDVIEGIRTVEFRRDGYDDYCYSLDDCSPFSMIDNIRESEAAVYWLSGWYDGALTNSAVRGYMSLPAKSKLIMGPWDHGPHDKVSPYAQSSTVQFDVQAEMLRFFDRHLKGVDNGIMQEPPVRYYTLGAEAWRTAQTWPPQGTRQRTWHLHPDSTLKTHQPPASAQHVLKPTYERGTGPTSRWNSQTGLYRNGTTGYPNIKAFQQPLPTYTTAPLETPLEITGFPIADLKISADTIDASVFVYLLDVAPDGQVHYITEGLFRARHRKISSAEPPYAQGGPYHSYEAADSLHLTPGQPARMKFALLPISYELPAGHRLRVAFAGLDKDHFQKIQPAPKRVTFHLGEGGCRLQLPTLQRGQASAQEPK